MLWNTKEESAALDGARMDCVHFGRGGKNLIILPGLSDGLASVKGKALLLAPPYRLFFETYTVWMFSRREPLPQGVTIRDMAADQAAALRALGIEKTSVLGVSQGGMIAQLLAAEHPELVDKLVLAVTAPCVNDIIRERVENWIALAEKGEHQKLMIDTAENSYSEAYLRKYRKLYPLLGGVGRPKSYERFLANARAILAFDGRDLQFHHLGGHQIFILQAQGIDIIRVIFRRADFAGFEHCSQQALALHGSLERVKLGGSLGGGQHLQAFAHHMQIGIEQRVPQAPCSDQHQQR